MKATIYRRLTLSIVFLVLMSTALGSVSATFAQTHSSPLSFDIVGNSPSVPGTCDAVPAGNIEVEGTILGTTPTAYATLNAAFTAINNGTHTGVISIDVCGNTTETASAVLNATGGTANYSSVTMVPVGGARTITGSIVGAIIKLNGADNVTIDGRIGGTGRNLTVTNSSTSAATAAIWLASVVAGNGATNNVIRNLELAAGATQNTSTSSTFGIYMGGTTISTSATDGNDNDNNSFIANRIIRVRYGIATRGTTSNLNIAPIITDNIIGPSAFGVDEIGKVGIFMQCDTGATISRNTVQFVGGDFANTTGGGDRVGIAIGIESWSSTPGTITSANYTVTKNIVHDVIEERTFSAVGITLGTINGGLATNNLIANNFIYNVKSNGTSGDQTVGLGIAGGHTDTVVFNSLRQEGDLDPNASATASSNTAVNIRIANTPTNLTVKNNSLYLNVSSSSTPSLLSANIQVTSATFAFGTGGLNNNNYYFPPSNTTARTGAIGAASTATTFFQTLAQWKVALTPAQDANSIQADPLYLSATDLHISSSSPNESAGVAITGVTDDIDADARPATPDIGADEVATPAGPGTLQFSSSTYSVSEATGTVTINVTRTGGSTGAASVDYATSDGTATGGASCGGTVDYTTASGTLNWANGDSAVKSFVVTVCLDGLSESSETVNLALSNAVGATLGTPNTAVLTITNTEVFNGTVNVGAGETYTSLTNVGGFFEAVNGGVLSGNVTANITSDLTLETGTVALNQWTESGAGGYTLTIKPSGAARTISGSSSAGLIKLNGADRVTIDGSLSGGTDRSLTIQNTATTANTATIWVASLGTGAGATNNTIKNSNILAGSNSTISIFGIFAAGTVISSSGTGDDNDNLTIQNNAINTAYYGMRVAASSTGLLDGLSIMSNYIGSSTAANYVTFRGIELTGATSPTVSQNEIFNLILSTLVNNAGIDLGANIASATVSRNNIHDIQSNSASGYGAYGINISSATGTSGITISNNFISGIKTYGWNTSSTTYSPFGIRITGGTNHKLYYNSVNMFGSFTTTTGGDISAALLISSSAATGLDIRDNIFKNSYTGTGSKNYSVYAVSGTTFGTINYNDYYSNGTGNVSGFLNYLGADVTTLTAWQTATGQDLQSMSADPLFTSATDLHITSSSSPVSNAGTPIAGITTDFDGDTRSTTYPDIGADEFGANPTLVSLESLTATQASDGSGTRIEWKTGYEVSNLGFNLYREVDGKRALVNPSLIAGSAFMSGGAAPAGQSYAWFDSAATSKEKVRYWLEDLDISGEATMHGPYVAVPARTGQIVSKQNQATLLNTLGQTQGVTKQVERQATESKSTGPATNDLAGQAAVKLSVRQEGWYRATQAELVAAGLNPNVDPRNLQMYVDGLKIAIHVNGEADGRLDPQDSVEFYGLGIDTPTTNTHVYWLAAGSEAGLRISQARAIGAPTSGGSFPYTVERKDRTIYFSSLLNGDAENFFGPAVTGQGMAQTLQITNLDSASPRQATLEVALQGTSSQAHHVSVSLNGASVGTITFANRENKVATFALPQDALREGDNTVNLLALGGTGDVSLVDRVRITYAHTYRADADALRFIAEGGSVVTVGGFTSAQIRVLDATNPAVPVELTGAVRQEQGGSYSVTLTLPGAGERTILALANARALSAPAAANRPSSWRTPAQGADLVIITTRSLKDSINPLAEYRANQGYEVAVVDVEDIYDEWSYGAHTPQALRDFNAYAHANWSLKPRYLLLVGDSSLDPKDYLGRGEFDMVPTRLVDTQYLETASDDWLADFNSDGISELAMGRLPARTGAEATLMVQKVIRYDQTGSTGGALLISGTNDAYNFEDASARLRTILESVMSVTMINRGNRDPQVVKQEIIAAINAGKKLVNYTGHGSVGLWGGSVFNNADALALTNGQNLPLFVAMTCLNGYYQDPSQESLAEALLKAEHGGAVAVWSSTGLTTPELQNAMNQELYRALFRGTPTGTSGPGEAPLPTRRTFGEAVMAAKASVSDPDVRRTWILFGDPTSRLR